MNDIGAVNGAVAGVRGSVPGAGGAGRAGKPREGDFQAQLEECRLRFSRHASERLRRRNIVLDGRDLARLERAVDTAQSKGAVNSLILTERLALIVNVATRNVITACSRDGLKDGVFTNIDSTVIVEGD
jgi:flagellar operon protein